MNRGGSPFGGLTLVPLAILIIVGFMYISTHPGESIMGFDFGGIALSAILAFVMNLFLSMDFGGNPLIGFFGGLISFFILIKMLVGLP